MSGTETRRARRSVLQKLVIIGNVFAMLGFVFTAGALAYGYQKYGQIPRIEIGDTLSASEEPEDGAVVAENFLIVGIDSAAGLDPDDPVASSRTDVAGLRS